MATEQSNNPEVHGAPVEIDPAIRTTRQGSDGSLAIPKQNVEVFSTESNHNISSSASSHEHNTPFARDRPWRTLFFRLGPLSGIACLILVLLSMLVSLGVLLGSHGVPVKDWTVEPSAILAICTAVANQAMRYAAFQGLMIAWWHRALRGSSIETLHTDWRAGMTIIGAASAGRRMGVLGLACIFSTLVAVDGPLLQKATHVANAQIQSQPVALNVSILPELPSYYWAGYVRSNKTTDRISVFNKTIPAPNNRSVPNDVHVMYDSWLYRVQGPWLRKEPISGAIHGCPSGSQCKLKVRAPAIAVTECTPHQLPVDYLRLASESSVTSNLHAPPLDREGFIVDISLVVGEPKETINLVTGYSKTVGCVGTLYYTACTLEAAVADYDVTLHGDAVTSLNAKTPTIVALSNNTRPSSTWSSFYGWHDSALAGITALAYLKWQGSAPWACDPTGPAHYTWGSQNDIYKDYDLKWGNASFVCANYFDPKDDILEDMNRLMFYAGYVFGSRVIEKWKAKFVSELDSGLEINPTVTGHTFGNRNMYQTNLRWFGAAAGVEVLCIALVLPTFIGWWRLGRPVSFSPIEIAKAFEAPLLSDCNSNSSGRDIARRIGCVRVQYGSTIDNNTRRRKLAFADPATVQHPQQGSCFEM